MTDERVAQHPFSSEGSNVATRRGDVEPFVGYDDSSRLNNSARPHKVVSAFGFTRGGRSCTTTCHTAKRPIFVFRPPISPPVAIFGMSRKKVGIPPWVCVFFGISDPGLAKKSFFETFLSNKLTGGGGMKFRRFLVLERVLGFLSADIPRCALIATPCLVVRAFLLQPEIRGVHN